MPTFLKKTIRICKKFLQYIFYLFLSIITLLILALFIVRFFLPTERLKKVAINTVERTFSRRLSIGDIYLNVFKGFEFNDIQLDPISDSIDAFPLKSARIKKIVLKYNLAKILKRQFIIQEILVSSPQFELAFATTRPVVSDSIKKIPPIPVDSLFQQIIPVSIHLKRLSFENVEIQFLLTNAPQTQKLFMEDIDFTIDNLQIPKGVISDQDSLISGAIHLGCKDSRFSFAQTTNATKDLDFSSKIDINVDLKAGRLDNMGLAANIKLDEIVLKTASVAPLHIDFPIFLSLDSRVDLESQHVAIKPVEIKVDDIEWFNIHANVDSFLTHPHVEFGIDKGELPIQQLYKLAQQIMPDSLMPKFRFTNENSRLCFLNTKIWGVIPDSVAHGEMNFTSDIRLEDFGASLNSGLMGFEKLNLFANIRGQAGYNNIQNLKINTTVSYDTLYYKVSDTLNVNTGKGNFSNELVLNEKFLPTRMSTSLSIENILGSKLVGNFSLAGSKSLHDLRGLASLSLTEIDFNRIMPSPISTTASLDIKAKINSLDSISISGRLATDLLTLTQIDEEPEVLPSLELLMNAECRTDTLFQDIVINPITGHLNEILDIDASAQLKGGGKESFEVTISRLQINHKPIFAWIPERILEQIEGLQIDGYTMMKAKLAGKLTTSILKYQASADITTENLNIFYPALPLSVKGIDLSIHGETISDQMTSLDFSLQIDSTQTDNLKELIFLNNKLNFLMTSKDFQTLHIRNGRIQMPTLYTFGDFQADIDSLSFNQKINATFHLNQAIKDSLKIFPELTLSGMTEVTVDFQMDTNLVNLAAFLKTTNFNINMPNQLKVQNIDTDVKFHQRVNLHNLTFLGRETNPIQTPSGSSIDYLLYRSAYHSSLPDLSHLQIDKIQVANYVIDKLNVEMFLGEGLIDIPSFICQMYGGNLGGSLWLNMAGGDISQAQYQIWSHFSGINSALLIQGATGEERKGIINGNLNFQGKGLDPDKKIDLEGFFNITEIEPKVADNLLRSLDPQGLDPGIKSTRTLINHGFKPKLMSFRLQHGYFYPSIPLSQPWYFPLRISGGNIELNRLPMEFFLERAKQFSATAP
jgi:hypothetical protein